MAGPVTPAAAPPVEEIGTEQPWGSLGVATGGAGPVAPWRSFVDFWEETPELAWPNNIRTYNTMRTDSQVEALYWGSVLPIRRYKWSIDPNGSRAEVVKQAQQDFNLPLKGEDAKPRPRMRGKFSWDKTLFHILLAILYGHMYFEPVGEIGDDVKWHLTKLSPRMPDTIAEILVDDQGELKGLKQYSGFNDKPIPASNLVPFVWEKEGANWAGRSILRSIYRDFVAKDRLLRLDVIRHQRNGAGVPVVESPPNASRQTIDALNALAQNFKVGEAAGGALPNQAKMTLQGVQGTMSDILGSIKARDEAMGRRFLMMFMQLGQTETGSRALGGEFIDWFALAQEAIANWVVDTFVENMIEPWTDWNYGETEEFTPRLHFERDEDTQLAASDLVALINAGAVTVDDELEEALRAKYDLPSLEADQAKRTKIKTVNQDGEEFTPPTPPQPGEGDPSSQSSSGETPASPDAPAAERRSARQVRRAAAPSALPLPDRKLRRQPYDHELAAQTDFASLDSQWAAGVKQLLKDWSNVRATQISEVHDQIAKGENDLTKLAKLGVTPIGADVIETHLHSMAEKGAATAIAEGEKQGVTVPTPDLGTAKVQLGKRAEAVDRLLADSLAQAASRRAVQIAGGSLGPKDVADDVRDYLGGLSDSWLADQFGGALSAAQNAGRKEAIDGGPPSQIYASELLDSNTCDPCTEVDGTNYATMDEAEADYPTGGYFDCDGGPRCRGTIVAVYDEASTEDDTTDE